MKINPVFIVSTFILELMSANIPRSRSVHFIKLEHKDKQAKQSKKGKSKNFRLTDGEMQGLVVCKVFSHTHVLQVDTKVCNIAFMLKPMPTIKKVSLHAEAGFSLCFYPEMP